jgi:hypothetical protein
MTIPPDERERLKQRIGEIVARMDEIPLSLDGAMTDEWRTLLAEMLSLGQQLMDLDPQWNQPGDVNARDSS